MTIGITNLNPIDLILPEDKEAVYKIIAEDMFENNLHQTNEFRSLTKDGREIWISAIGVKTEYQGRLAGLISIRDITELKLAEFAKNERLKELNCLYGISKIMETPDLSIEEIFRKVINLVPTSWQYPEITVCRIIVDGIEYKEPNFKKTDWMQSSDIKVAGKNVGIIEIYNLVKMPDSDEGPFLKEERMVLDYVAERMGHIVERKQAEEALRESEEKYRNLIVTTSEGFWLIDSGQKTIDVNQSLCNMLGYSRSEMIDKTPFDFVNDENLKVLKEQASRITTTLHRTYEIILKKKNGINLPTIFNATSLIDKNGKPCGSFVLLTDITERKLAETELVKAKEKAEESELELQSKNEEYETINEELNQTNEDLHKAKEKAEESDRLKSAFLSNMSHEIRTPMNGILGFSDLLKEPGLTGEEQQSYVAVIKKSGTRMLNTINDIISMSKIEAGLIELNMQESNINDQIEYIYTFFKPEMERKGMQFSFRNSLPSNEAIINIDREKVYSILTNLVKNAVKYSEKGSIEFGYTLKKDGELAELEFYVKDTGIGIPKDRQKAIFDRFIQADIADKHAFQGSGLGLSISKAYIEMLGGKIWVESEEGKGSTFYFTLPYQSETIKENSSEYEILPPVEVSPIKKLKILIAEDDETSDELLSIAVQKIGSEIISVRTGTEAVTACRDNPDIDLVLMDIAMPGINGYEATRQIRKFNKDVIIVAQTAFGLSGDREKALSAGCNDYIAKPIKKDELLEKIEKLLS